jgi:hypothetical protein
MQQLPKLDSKKINHNRRKDVKYNSFAHNMTEQTDDVSNSRGLQTGRNSKRPNVLTAHKQTRPTTIDNSY